MTSSCTKMYSTQAIQNSAVHREIIWSDMSSFTSRLSHVGSDFMARLVELQWTSLTATLNVVKVSEYVQSSEGIIAASMGNEREIGLISLETIETEPYSESRRLNLNLTKHNRRFGSAKDTSLTTIKNTE